MLMGILSMKQRLIRPQVPTEWLMDGWKDG